jgi:RNA polymerase sigma factor (sigma-70 family)
LSSIDPPVSHELLLENQAFLRRLAQSLVWDPALADDLVQETALAALRRPPQPTGSPRAWLARVMRNLAVSRARSETRRRAREQDAARSDSVELGDHLGAQLEVQRRVVDAVARLAEPYRSVILLRYFHELSADQIADRLDVPTPTVRTRLARGLARLRENLDERDVHGTPAWGVVLLHGLSDTQRTTVTTALAAGGAAMAVKLVWTGSIVAVAVLAGTWWMLREPVGPDLRAVSAAGAVATVGEPAVGTEPASLPVDPELEQARSAVDPPTREPVATKPAAWSLELALRGWSAHDVGPIAIGMLRPTDVEPKLSVQKPLAEELSIDLGGLLADPGARPDQLKVRLDHPDYLPIEIGVLVPQELLGGSVESGRLEAVATLERATVVVTGRVDIDDPEGAPRVRVASFPLESGTPARGPTEVTTPDGEGRYRLRLGSGDQHAVVAYLAELKAPSGAPMAALTLRPDTRILTSLAPGVHEVAPLVLGLGEVVAGRVTLPDGGPPSSGTLTLELTELGNVHVDGMTWKDARFEVYQQSMKWTGDGGFRFAGLAPTHYRLTTRTHSSIAGGIPLMQVVNSDDGGTVVLAPADVNLQLDRMRVLFVVLGDGQPVEKAKVEVRWKVGLGEQAHGTKTDALGQVYLELNSRDQVTFSVEDPRFPRKDVEFLPNSLQPDGLVEVQLEGPLLEPTTLLIRFDGDRSVLSKGGVNFTLYDLERTKKDEVQGLLANMPYSVGSGGSVWIVPHGPYPKQRFSDGTWTLSDVPRSRYVIRAVPATPDSGPTSMLMPEIFEVDLRGGGLVELTWIAEIGGVMRVNLSALSELQQARLLDATGGKIPLNFVRGVVGVEGFQLGGVAMGPGVYEIRPSLAAGPYLLELVLQNGAQHTLTVGVKAGQVNDVVVEPDDL